jgi:hypothetical protein
VGRQLVAEMGFGAVDERCGLTDQREPVEQCSKSLRPSAADSVRGTDLTALRTPLPQATLGTYVETIRSMPTPYGLLSTSQNLVQHQLTLTQPNQVIWYSLEPKNVNDFMSFLKPDSRRYRKGVSSANLELYRPS